jgi:hypothetical protein
MASRIIMMSFLLSVFGHANVNCMRNKGSVVAIVTNLVVSKCVVGDHEEVNDLPAQFSQVYLPLVNQNDWRDYKGHLQFCSKEKDFKFHASSLKSSKESAVKESILLIQKNPPCANIQSVDGKWVIDLEGFDDDKLASLSQALDTMHVVVKLTHKDDKEEYQVHKVKALSFMIPTQPDKEQIVGIDKGYEDSQIDLESGARGWFGTQKFEDTIYFWPMRNRICVGPHVLNQIQGLFEKKNQFILSLIKDNTTINMRITKGSRESCFYNLNEAENMEVFNVTINNGDNEKKIDKKSWLSAGSFTQLVGFLILMGVGFKIYKGDFSGDNVGKIFKIFMGASFGEKSYIG